MHDAELGLAFALQRNAGAYAVLVGAGMSREAGLPAAWDVQLDLIGQLRALRGESGDDDPVAWFRATFGQEPDYNRLLSLVASTPAERQAVLRGYFEPDGQPAVPSAAHRALAGLVAAGTVRVVVTVNFDHLVEDALRAAGVEPTVVSRPEQFASMVPLHAQRALVVHLHGDWTDPASLLNTEEELASYPEASRRLVGQVAGEYGLVLVGWSSTWDPALRELLAESRNPFFSTWWYDPFPLSRVGQRLLVDRPAVQVPEAAGVALPRLLDAVSTAAVGRGLPTSPQVAAAGVHRRLRQPGAALEVADEVAVLAEQLRQHPLLAARRFDAADPHGEAGVRMAAWERDSQVLRAVAAQAVRSSPDGLAWGMEAVAALVDEQSGNGSLALLQLQDYPATLLFATLGVAAAVDGRLASVGRLLRELTVTMRDGVRLPAVEALDSGRTTPYGNASGRVFGVLQETFVGALGVPQDRWERAWELLEYLTMLESTDGRLSQQEFLDLLPAVEAAWAAVPDPSRRWPGEGEVEARELQQQLTRFRGIAQVRAAPHLRTLGFVVDFRPRVSGRWRWELRGDRAASGQSAALLEAGFARGSRTRLMVLVSLVDDLVARIVQDAAWGSATDGGQFMRNGPFWLDRPEAG